MPLMELETKTAYLLLGTNLGERELHLQQALALIEHKVGVIKNTSAIYETAAWGKTDQPGFLNLAVEVASTLEAIDLLHQILEIEKSLGRIRHEKWGSRVIDIDIILFNNEMINVENKLQIPHPEMQNRKFVMQPLAEIAPNLVHPILKKSMVEILNNIGDPLTVTKL